MNDKSVQKALFEIGHKLKQLRKKKGYNSCESFASDNQLPRVHYWRIEAGKVNLTIKSLVKILSIHKITVDEFFSKSGDPKKKQKDW